MMSVMPSSSLLANFASALIILCLTLTRLRFLATAERIAIVMKRSRLGWVRSSHANDAGLKAKADPSVATTQPAQNQRTLGTPAPWRPRDDSVRRLKGRHMQA